MKKYIFFILFGLLTFALPSLAMKDKKKNYKLEFLNAIKIGNLGEVRSLIEKGFVDIGKGEAISLEVLISIMLGKEEIVKYLTQKMRVNNGNKNGEGLKHLIFSACMYGNLEMVKYFIKTLGVDKNHKNDIWQ